MHIERIQNTPITSNCYVLHEVDWNDCIIIDPGSYDNSELIEYLNKKQLTPSVIILTHEHFDHIWGLVDLTFHYKFDLICNAVCAEAIKSPKKNLSLFHNQVGFSILNEVKTTESLNQLLIWKRKNIKFIQTPGHSEGSISIHMDNFLFCGDVLIQNEKTVTKLPGGSAETLKNTSARLKLDIHPYTMIHSGHGESFIFENYFLFNQL